MPKLQQFNGGVNSRKASHLLPINEGPIFNNIDIEEEILKPVKGLGQEVLGLTDEARYIQHAGEIQTLAKTPHTVVEYQDKVYYSVLGDFIQVKDAESEGDLGLLPPQITYAGLASTVPAQPTALDITYSETEAGYSSAFIVGNTYDFAIIHVDSEGIDSLPYFFSKTIGYAASGYNSISFTLPYTFKIYQKIAGVWKGWTTENYLAVINGTIKRGTAYFLANVVNEFVAATTITTLYIPGTTMFTGETFGWSVEEDLDGQAAQNVFNGTYSYVVTLGVSSLGWESAPSDLMLADTEGRATDTIVLRIDESTADARVDTMSVYRIGGTITDFTLVREFDLSNWPRPWGFADRIADLGIAGNRILETENNDKAFEGITNLTEASGQLIGTYGTKLYFSEKGKLYAIPPTNYRDFKETLTGCFNIDAGLLIFSATKTWLLNTSNLATGKVIKLSDNFGCVGHKTIVGYKTGAMWASLVGLCTSSGGKVELITKDKIGYVDLDITRAAMHNEIYYGFTDRGICYALDMRYTPAFYSHTFSLLDDYDAATEVRQIYIEGTELKLLFGSPTDVDSLTVFGSATDEALNWVSPTFLDGAYTELKTYKDFYVRATANITFNIYIDDKLVSSDTFHKYDTHEIMIPQEEHQGYSMYFTATGTGKLYEIEYKAMGRQNGR